jgi:hypothetical protein
MWIGVCRVKTIGRCFAEQNEVVVAAVAAVGGIMKAGANGRGQRVLLLRTASILTVKAE